MSKLINYLVASFLLLTSHVALSKVELVSSELDRSTLVLKLTVHNPDTAARRVVEMGVNQDVAGGIKCGHTGSEPKVRSLADYRIEFSLMGVQQSLVRADPLVLIPPGENLSFTLALSPDTGGVCGNWSFEVNGLAVLDDGTKLKTAKTIINSDDFKAALNRNSTRTEVSALLQHRDHILRIKGIEKLNAKDFDVATLESALAAGLDDPNPWVRTTAYKKIASLKLLGFEPALRAKLQRLARPKNRDERNDYSSEAMRLVDALVEMKSMGAADQILDLIENRDFNFSISLGSSLQMLQSPAVLAKIIDRLNKNKAWASVPDKKNGPDEEDGEAKRYLELLRALISYRDPSTLPLLKSIMEKPENRPAVRSIMHAFINLTRFSPQAEDPFLRNFLQYAEKYLSDDGKDDKVNVRGTALILFVSTTSDPHKKVRLLRNALKDSSVSVRLDAAKVAGALKLKELVPELRRAHKLAGDKQKDYFCEPLKQLDETCDLLTLPVDAPKVTWREEVAMPGSKETLVVERTVMRQILKIGYEKNSIPSQHIIRFQDAAASKQMIEWRSSKVGGPAGIYPEFPLVLGKARDGTLFVYTSRSVIGAACFRYSKYQFKGGTWFEVDLPLNIETWKANLYLGADENMSTGFVSLAQKAEEKDNPRDPDFYRQVGPKKYHCQSHYSGPYPPIERSFR